VSDLVVTDVRKAFETFVALHGVSLEIQRGEFVTLLGPSGCGKTTTLNVIAGFLEPDGGEIAIAGRPMKGVPSHKRNLGMVFQNYALFPHLTVFDNIAFGLKMRRVERAEIARRVDRALALVRMPGLERRYPKQLSGGQQQRVALARALVIEPAILLLDEPLSNLDAKLREEMRVELREIQKEVGITTVFVTHDQEEALVMSDRIAVMNRGVVEQIGTPAEIYERPATPFVAQFVGESNWFRGHVEKSAGGIITVKTEEGMLVRAHSSRAWGAGDRVELIIRPEKLRVEHIPGESTAITAVLERVFYLGASVRCLARYGNRQFLVSLPNVGPLARLIVGAEIGLGWNEEDVVLLPSDV
jgi:putative spermidine/putrescine transport system ATP-binding protein